MEKIVLENIDNSLISHVFDEILDLVEDNGKLTFKDLLSNVNRYLIRDNHFSEDDVKEIFDYLIDEQILIIHEDEVEKDELIYEFNCHDFNDLPERIRIAIGEDEAEFIEQIFDINNYDNAIIHEDNKEQFAHFILYVLKKDKINILKLREKFDIEHNPIYVNFLDDLKLSGVLKYKSFNNYKVIKKFDHLKEKYVELLKEYCDMHIGHIKNIFDKRISESTLKFIPLMSSNCIGIQSKIDMFVDGFNIKKNDVIIMSHKRELLLQIKQNHINGFELILIDRNQNISKKDTEK